jgi:hypothetical protein
MQTVSKPKVFREQRYEFLVGTLKINMVCCEINPLGINPKMLITDERGFQMEFDINTLRTIVDTIEEIMLENR